MRCIHVSSPFGWQRVEQGQPWAVYPVMRRRARGEVPSSPSSDVEARTGPESAATESGVVEKPTRPVDEAFDDTAPATMPTGGWARLGPALAEMAREHARQGDVDGALRAADDALALLPWLETARATCLVRKLLGETFVALGRRAEASEHFEAAIRLFDARGDRRGAADARYLLGCALLAREDPDPRSRTLLEDAGLLFEELGDDVAARLVEAKLAEADDRIEESPRSFSAVFLPAAFKRTSR